MAGYPYPETIYVRFCPSNPFGVAPFSSAITFSTVMTSKIKGPLPPCNVKLNNLGYGSWPATISTDALLSWTNKNRSLHGPGSKLYWNDDSTVEAIEGVVRVDVYVDGVYKRRFDNQTGSSITYTRAMRLADNSDMTKYVYFTITPILDGVSGVIRTTPPFVMS